MTREYPMVSQFRADSPKCPSRGFIGCAVATTEALLRRYRPQDQPIRQVDLAASMGRRHRVWAKKNGGKSTHGVCPSAFCPFCSYLELKARLVPVAYGRLTVAQLRAHLRKRHAIHLGGTYGEIHKVSPSSYSSTTVARGRSDSGIVGGHSIVVWEVGEEAPDGTPRTYIVSDSDFGSPARPRIPKYCEYDANEIEAMYVKGGWSVAYTLTAPPSLDGAKIAAPVPGTTNVHLAFGGMKKGRGLYVVTNQGGANQRTSPFVRAGNVRQLVPQGTEFRVHQTTLSGTNVGGSPKWRGDATGTIWMHESVIRPVG
jgi:hypothetical protein